MFTKLIQLFAQWRCRHGAHTLGDWIADVPPVFAFDRRRRWSLLQRTCSLCGYAEFDVEIKPRAMHPMIYEGDNEVRMPFHQ